MAIEVVMPRLGWDMEEGALVEWIKHDGDLVQVGDIICTIEGDKSVNEIESMDAGVLRIPASSPRPGERVAVGTVLAYLTQPGEAAPFDAAPQAEASAAAPEAETAVAVASPEPAVVGAPSEGSSRPTNGASWRSRHDPPISPRARRIAAELGIDWEAMSGSGRTGRIVERDVRRAAALAASVDLAATSPETSSATASPVSAGVAAERTSTLPDGQAVPMSGIRRIIAQRMAASAHSVAPVTLTTEADATSLVRFREQIKADLIGIAGRVPSYSDMLVKIVALALEAHPDLNASLSGDDIVQHTSINVGVAVDTDRGLLVPVIRDARGKSLQQIADESADLIARTRGGQASAAELSGGTFTITNLGMYEIDAFTPIVNLPECAILGVGRIISRPVVVDEASETVAVRKMLALSLTFDHRVVDGAPAARFLQRVKRYVEHPTPWLIR